MKAVVTKINKNHAIIIKSDGSFMSIPDKSYKIGQEIYVKDSSKKGFVKFASAAAAAAVLFAMIGSGAVYAYNTPQSYVSIDVNTSVELELNMFNYVINAVVANEKGTAVLEKMELNHKSLNEAIELIICQAHLSGSSEFYDEKTVVVGVHSVNSQVEQKVMESTKEQIYKSLEKLQVSTSVSVANVNTETMENAKAFGTTAGKMSLIEDYIETVSSEVSVDELVDMPVDALSEGMYETNKEEKPRPSIDNSSKNEEKTNNGNTSEAKENKQKNDDEKTNNGKETVPKANGNLNNSSNSENNKDKKTNNSKDDSDD